MVSASDVNVVITKILCGSKYRNSNRNHQKYGKCYRMLVYFTLQYSSMCHKLNRLVVEYTALLIKFSILFSVPCKKHGSTRHSPHYQSALLNYSKQVISLYYFKFSHLIFLVRFFPPIR